QDIKEGARALTGYTFVDDEFVFQENNHDAGPKKILGKSGDLDGDDFVVAILEQRACSTWIATKLYRFFVADYPSGHPQADAAAMRFMGQDIFYPPSVKGWDGGRAWINTSNMFVRQNILCYLLTGKLPVGYDAMANAEKYDPSPLLSALSAADASGAAASDPDK